MTVGHKNNTPHAPIAIVADDLTGAADTSAQLLRANMRTLILLDHEGLNNAADGYDVLVFDTDSRAISPVASYSRMSKLAESLCGAGIDRVYKKVDSTLRGNLGAEIDALLDRMEFDFAGIAPAFPAAGRTTVGGVQRVHGTPVHESDTIHRLAGSARHSDLRLALREQTLRRVGLVSLNYVREGGAFLSERVEELLGGRTKMVVFDAETDDELRRVAEELAWHSALWVGSAGLATHIPPNAAPTLHLPLEATKRTTSRQVLLVSGSTSSTTRDQLDYLNTQPGVAGIEMDGERVLAGEDVRLDEIYRCAGLMERPLYKQLDVALYVRPSEQGDRQDDPASAQNVANALATVAALAVNSVKLRGLILTGGDVARAVCLRLGIQTLEPISEVEPGIPLCKVQGRRMLIVTKAGGFGGRESLVRARQSLQED